MTKAFQSIPLVDIAGLSSPDPAARQAVADAMGRAAREVGFFYITGHGLPQSMVDAVWAAAEAFFAQPLEAKMESYIGRSTNHSGYVPEGEEVLEVGKVDKKEAYDVNFDVPHPAIERPMYGPNLWPPCEGFRPAVSAYYAAVADLSRRIFRGFALALGLPENRFEAHLTQPPSQLRVLHYPYDSEAINPNGIGAHTDFEFFTVLGSTAPGLEVRNGAGAWIAAPPIPGAFVVNIGDMLEVWTNGEFAATAHRVRAVTQERYSLPYFATCDFETVVAPAPEFVSPERPAKYAPIVSGEHLYHQTVRSFRYLEPLRASIPERSPARYG
jgi:isopenicillin N synthase-like dioxygenase